jgi:hypothetical protein
MSSSNSNINSLASLLAICRNNPILFNDAVLQRSKYWEKQEEICRSVVDYRVTVCYTGNMTGKDYVVGGVVPWWLWTRPNSEVIVTGPSQTILGSVTWKEIRRAVEGSAICKAFSPKFSRGVKTSPQILELAPGWQALGFSTTSVERASGHHGGNILVIGEEASGIEQEIADAIESLGYLRLLLIGNPIRADGWFVDMIRQAGKDQQDAIPKHLAVNAIRISSRESPHAEMEKSPVGLADRTWIQSTERRYGKNSLWVRCHIEAEIPEVSSQSLFELRWLDLATTIPRDPDTLNPAHPAYATRRISGDLAEGVGRDSTSIWVTDDWGILEVVNGDASNLADTAYKYFELGRQWGIPASRMSYDCLGAVGREFPLHLSRWNLGDAVGYAGSGGSPDPAFTNLRTYAGITARQRLNPEGADDYRKPHAARTPFTIPPGDYWPRLREELSKLTYHLVKSQTALLSKEDHAKTLGHSPDYADGFLQRFGFT